MNLEYEFLAFQDGIHGYDRLHVAIQRSQLSRIVFNFFGLILLYKQRLFHLVYLNTGSFQIASDEVEELRVFPDSISSTNH